MRESKVCGFDNSYPFETITNNLFSQGHQTIVVGASAQAVAVETSLVTPVV